MTDRLPKLDSHIIDYFLYVAEKMEDQLDDESYASVKRMFDKDVFMYEKFIDSSPKIGKTKPSKI